ncbi:unnamed protein product [Rotaria sordida]|uniref:F-box domain-containing protein n=1 Tax=Rotaria sordida TaxID=392033 RepID=A0A819FLX9_9BILA|nr:unnamed protein product [Rotaria sordida]CAF3868882.1 unnamed protein product [Rotaria sordida]
MNTYTCLEDLSNEIFFEIFDYLYALDIFTAFGSLNKRISSILQSIPLHVIILNNHYDKEINLLSSYLTFHADQVISLKCYDTIRDRSSIISLLFNRHHFINLQSCIFIFDKPSNELENVLKQIENLHRLVTFYVTQSNYKKISEKDECDIIRTIFMNKLSSLRSVTLHYDYNYSNISTYTLNASNLISLDLLISGKVNTISIYSILPILRVCHRIRYLHAIINEEIPSKRTFRVRVQEPFINENDLVISPQIKSFHLSTTVECNIHSIGLILRCMPNLIHFKFYHGTRKVQWQNAQDLINGHKWQNMFEIHVPFLSKFDFHMSIMKYNPKCDLDMIINSFEYFVKKNPEWQLIVDRWENYDIYPGEFLMLRTIDYHKYKRNLPMNIPLMDYESFETRSTKTTTNDHYLYYSDTKYLELNLTTRAPRINSSFPLYQHINSLMINMPVICSSSSNNSLNIKDSFKSNVQSNENDYTQECISCLSKMVYLSNVYQIEFQTFDDPIEWKYIQCVLQACPNVINLKISSSYWILSEFIDNKFLISIFKQIKILKSIKKNRYIPSNFLLKLVERFPSITNIEFEMFSFDDCISTIDILLNYLKDLCYLKIYYYQDSLLDYPVSRNYVIDKRREAFNFNIINEYKVTVTKNREFVEIRLS